MGLGKSREGGRELVETWWRSRVMCSNLLIIGMTPSWKRGGPAPPLGPSRIEERLSSVAEHGSVAPSISMTESVPLIWEHIRYLSLAGVAGLPDSRPFPSWWFQSAT